MSKRRASRARLWGGLCGHPRTTRNGAAFAKMTQEGAIPAALRKAEHQGIRLDDRRYFVVTRLNAPDTLRWTGWPALTLTVTDSFALFP